MGLQDCLNEKNMIFRGMKVKEGEIIEHDSLYNELINSTNELVQYTGYRLLLNLVLLKRIDITEELKSHIQNRAANCSPIVSPVLRSILEES